MGPKKSNKSFYIGAGIVGYIFILLLSGQMGKYEARHPTADFGKVFSQGFSNLFSNPFDIFPLSASAFKYIG